MVNPMALQADMLLAMCQDGSHVLADLTPDFFSQGGEGLPDKAKLAEVDLVKLLHLQGAEIHWRDKEQMLNSVNAAGVCLQ